MTENALKVFLSLLRAGLWGMPFDAQEVPALSVGEWKEVLSMSERQTVAGVTFLGLDSMPEDRMPPVGVIGRWAARADAIERRNKNINSEIVDLYFEFARNGLEPVLQKGQGIAALYRCPLSRECGDIDLWFSTPEGKESADKLIRSKGINVRNRPDGSSCYVSGRGFVVEHHLRFYDLYNPFVQKYLHSLTSGLELDRTLLQLSGVTIPVPAPEHCLLMLYAHVLKHSIGRGIGMRQLCDAAVACDRYRYTLDRKLFRGMCRHTGIARWVELMNSFMTGYIGLPLSSLPYKTKDTDASGLFDIVIEGGNFGRYDTSNGHPDMTGFRRKIHTAMAFLRNSRFSLPVASGETAGVFLMLLKGQI